MIEILINLYIQCNYMKTDELIVIMLLINVKCVDYNVNLVYKETMYDNKCNFMIFVRTKLLTGSWLTCQLDCKNRMANHIIFRF